MIILQFNNFKTALMRNYLTYTVLLCIASLCVYVGLLLCDSPQSWQAIGHPSPCGKVRQPLPVREEEFCGQQWRQQLWLMDESTQLHCSQEGGESLVIITHLPLHNTVCTYMTLYMYMLLVSVFYIIQCINPVIDEILYVCVCVFGRGEY